LFKEENLTPELSNRSISFLKFKQFLLVFIFLIPAGAPNIYAQPDSNEDLSELSLEELMDIRVVSSTKENVRLAEVPSTAFVVNGDQIRKWGIRRLSELIDRLVPGAIAAEDFDDIIFAFRGITSDNNLKVLLLLNGHEYNTQWNNGPTSEAELGLLDDVKMVEVLIGPHTALYGSAAVIGVINLITNNGREFSGVEVNANYGSGDYKRGGFIVGNHLSDDLDYFFSAGGLAADGYDNNNNSPLNISRFPPSWRFFGNINYKKIELMSRFTRSSRAFYIQQASTTSPNLWSQYDTFFISARRTFQQNPNMRHVLDLSYDAIQTQRHDFVLGLKHRAVGEDRYTVKLTTFYSPWEKHHLVLGGSYRRDEFGDDWDGDNFEYDISIKDGQVVGIPVDPYTVRVLTPYGRNAYALFGQDSIRLSQHFSLLLGFRYDRVEAPQIDRPNTFSPRVALVMTPNPKTVFKAMVTSGVGRQINAAVTSPDAFAFGATVINDAQKPERLNSFELAASRQINPRLDLSFNVFYNSLRDIFGVDPNGPSGAIRLINSGRIDFVGFEAIASVKPTPRSFLRIVHQNVQLGSVVDNIFPILTTRDNKHPSNYPENATKLLADVRLNKNFTVNANANLIWNNFSDLAGTRDTNFYSTVNANLTWQPKSGLEVILSVYNLFNKQKRIPPFSLLAFLPERNLNLNITYQF
jgi:outer membrane receptor protein involved in Fe transport